MQHLESGKFLLKRNLEFSSLLFSQRMLHRLLFHERNLHWYVFSRLKLLDIGKCLESLQRKHDQHSVRKWRFRFYAQRLKHDNFSLPVCEWLLNQRPLCHLCERRTQLAVCHERLPELQLRQRNLHVVPSASLGYRSPVSSRLHSVGFDWSYSLPLPQKANF